MCVPFDATHAATPRRPSGTSTCVEAEERPEGDLGVLVLAADLEARVLEVHALTRLRFSSWILRWAPVRRAGGMRRRRVRQRLEIGDVLAEDREGALRVDRRAVARDDPRRLLDPWPQALERREVRVAAAGLGQPRDLDGRQVVAADDDVRPRDPQRHPVLGVAVRGQEVELGVADPDVAGDRQRLDLPERQRPRALDVVLLVELAQLALASPGLARRRAPVVSAQPSAASGNA